MGICHTVCTVSWIPGELCHYFYPPLWLRRKAEIPVSLGHREGLGTGCGVALAWCVSWDGPEIDSGRLFSTVHASAGVHVPGRSVCVIAGSATTLPGSITVLKAGVEGTVGRPCRVRLTSQDAIQTSLSPCSEALGRPVVGPSENNRDACHQP